MRYKEEQGKSLCKKVPKSPKIPRRCVHPVERCCTRKSCRLNLNFQECCPHILRSSERASVHAAVVQCQPDPEAPAQPCAQLEIQYLREMHPPSYEPPIPEMHISSSPSLLVKCTKVSSLDNLQQLWPSSFYPPFLRWARSSMSSSSLVEEAATTLMVSMSHSVDAHKFQASYAI